MTDKPTRDLTAKEVWLRTIYLRLKKHNWNRSETARSLGLAPITIHRTVAKLRAAGLVIPDNPHGPPRKTLQ